MEQEALRRRLKRHQMSKLTAGCNAHSPFESTWDSNPKSVAMVQVVGVSLQCCLEHVRLRSCSATGTSREGVHMNFTASGIAIASVS